VSEPVRDPVVPLSSLVEEGRISYGIVQPGDDVADGVPIVRVKDLKNGVVGTSSPLRVAPEVSERHARTVLRGGEVLLSLVGTIGEAAVAPPQLAGWNVARAIAVIRPKEVEAEWLRRCFKMPSTVGYLDAVLNTTVQATLNLGDLGRLLLPLPDEQFRAGVLDLLGALDDKIAVNRSLADSVDRLLVERLRQLCADEEIRWVPLGTVADVNQATVEPGEGGLRYIDIASVGVGYYEYPALMSWSSAPGRARRKVGRGDVLWSCVRPNRQSHALNLSDDPQLVASTGLAVLTPRETGFAYLYQVVKLAEFVEFLVNRAEGSAYPAVNGGVFESAPVPLLPPEASTRFEQAAAPLREHVASLDTENRRLAELRDTLLPELMSGRMRVRDAEKQVEDVL
jgi:type I restriction enzyme S subunit